MEEGVGSIGLSQTGAHCYVAVDKVCPSIDYGIVLRFPGNDDVRRYRIVALERSCQRPIFLSGDPKGDQMSILLEVSDSE